MVGPIDWTRVQAQHSYLHELHQLICLPTPSELNWQYTYLKNEDERCQEKRTPTWQQTLPFLTDRVSSQKHTTEFGAVDMRIFQ